MKVIKLDRRYNGHATWTHRTDSGYWYGEEARVRGLVAFYEMRCYMTQMNGPGCFIDEAWALKRVGKTVPEWAWDDRGNVFFRGQALVNFQLAKERWAEV
jgi:hypothetical protein